MRAKVLTINIAESNTRVVTNLVSRLLAGLVTDIIWVVAEWTGLVAAERTARCCSAVRPVIPGGTGCFIKVTTHLSST